MIRENMQTKIKELFISVNNGEKSRKSVAVLNLDTNGILEDKFYNKNRQRSILITSVASYTLAKERGIELKYGALGENILIEANPYSLQEGERLFIGDTVLEITQHCTLCKGLSSINAQLPRLLQHDRGIFAKVISTHGVITKEDSVTSVTQ
jgi:MOSC domain-containing protein YiiM